MIVLNPNVNVVGTTTVIPCTYREVTFEEYLSADSKTAYANHREKCFCCCHCVKGIKGAIITLLVLSIITIILSFSAMMTSLSSMNEYKYLREKVLVEIEIADQTYRESNEPEPFRFDKFWYEFESFENSVLTVDIIFTAILIAFLILELVVYYIFLKRESKSGFIRRIFISTHYLFEICFKMIFLLLIYVMVYSIIVFVMNPGYYNSGDTTYHEQQVEWAAQKFKKGCIHFFILLLLTIFNGVINGSDSILFFLLEMWNEDDDNRIENGMDKIKTKSISLGGQSVNTQIKLNKALYLKDPSGKSIQFRQILLENIRNDYLFINVENEGIDNMLSISSWKYPRMDPVINFLKPVISLIFYSIFIIYVPLLFHIKDQPAYQELKLFFDSFKPEKIKFITIFKMIGNFENIVTTSRFYVYLIILIVFEIFVPKRYFFGGFSNLGLLTISYAFVIIAFILTIIYLILTIAIIVFSVLSIITVIDANKIMTNINQITMLLSSFYLQIALNSSFFCEIVRPVLSRLKNLFTHLGFCRSQLKSLYEPDIQGITQYEFLGLNLMNNKLTEVIIPGFPRFLFYSLNNVVMNEKIPDINLNINDNEKKEENANINVGQSTEEQVLRVSGKKHSSRRKSKSKNKK